MANTPNVHGAEEIGRNLQLVPIVLEKKIMRKAMYHGMKPIQADARAGIDSVSGQLARGLRISTGVRRAVVSSYLRATGVHAHVARWVEFGTDPHEIRARDGGFLHFGGLFARSVMHPGAQAKPFMLPALDNNKQQAFNAVAEEARRGLEREGVNLRVPGSVSPAEVLEP